MAIISSRDKANVMQLLLHTFEGKGITSPRNGAGYVMADLSNDQLKKLAASINDSNKELLDSFFFSPETIKQQQLEHPEAAYSDLRKASITVSQLHNLSGPKDISRDTGAFGLVCLFILRKHRLVRHSQAFRELIEKAWLLGQEKSKVRSLPFNTAVWPELKSKKAFKNFASQSSQPAQPAPTKVKAAEPPRPPVLPHNIKLLQEKFIGREADLKVLGELVDASTRMITIVGPGGIGKTRLVTEFCRRQLDKLDQKAWFVDLAEAGTEFDILSCLARVFEGPEGNSQLSDFDVLVRRISELGRCVIVLDNFEQIRQYAVFLWDKLCEHTPEVTYLVTSRNTLGVEGERVLQLGSLHYEEEAVSLFENHARSRVRDFKVKPVNKGAVLEIISHVEGFPLLIKLAAARINLFSVEEIRNRLASSLSLLATDTNADKDVVSHRIVGWSWDLLRSSEKAALAQLSVFEGPFSLEAALAVLKDSGTESEIIMLINTLVDNSLLFRISGGKQSLFRLHRVIQEFSDGQLQETSESFRYNVIMRHARYYAGLASEQLLIEISAGRKVEEYFQLRSVLDNFVAAFRNTIRLKEFELSCQNYITIQVILMKDGPFAKLHELTELLFNNPAFTAKAYPEDWPVIAHWMGSIKRLIGDFKGAREVFERLIDEVADEDHKQVRVSKKALAVALWNMGEADRAIELYNSIIERYLEEDPRIVGACYRDLAVMYWYQGKGMKALEFAQKGRKLNRKIGNTRYVMIAYLDLGMIYLEMEDISKDSDLKYLARCLEMAQGDNKDMAIEAIALMYQSVAAHKRQDFETAERRFLNCIDHCKSINYTNMLTQTCSNYAIMLLRMGENERALDVCDQGLETLHHYDNRWQEGLLNGIKGALLARQDQLFESMDYLEQADEILDKIDDNPVTRAYVKLFWSIYLKKSKAPAEQIDKIFAEIDQLLAETDFSGDAILAQLRRSLV